MSSFSPESRHYQRIEKAIAYLIANHRRQPSLDELARHVHMSPFHLQRLFTEWAGVSPKRFLQYLTRDYLQSRLAGFANLAEAAEVVGLSSASRVHDLFVTLDALTPEQYRSGAAGIEIDYGFHDTPFGRCFIAVTERGICALEFTGGNDADAPARLRTRWSGAGLHRRPQRTAAIVRQVFGDEPPRRPLSLLVKGTNFQIKVWEALLRIPEGGLTTYGDIAAAIGSSAASRAVGSAVGSNPVAFLIPCHRVIRREGVVGQYRWGEQRKAALIGWESARRAY